MPNWCHNRVTFKTKADLEGALKLSPLQVKDGVNQKEEYSFEVSVPSNYNESTCKEDSNSFHGTLWGIKWDMTDCRRVGPRTICFLTAWSPPINFYEKLASKGYNFMVKYDEPGCGEKGIGWAENGYFEYNDQYQGRVP